MPAAKFSPAGAIGISLDREVRVKEAGFISNPVRVAAGFFEVITFVRKSMAFEKFREFPLE